LGYALQRSDERAFISGVLSANLDISRHMSLLAVESTLAQKLLNQRPYACSRIINAKAEELFDKAKRQSH
jgi:hypothetical protein